MSIDHSTSIAYERSRRTLVRALRLEEHGKLQAVVQLCSCLASIACARFREGKAYTLFSLSESGVIELKYRARIRARKRKAGVVAAPL